MTLDIDAIRARADAATPGPWDLDWDEETVEVNAGTARTTWNAPHTVGTPARSWRETDRILEHDVEDLEPGGEDERRRVADAQFIAHAREDIPALVAAVTERDEQIAALQAQLDVVRTALLEPLDATKVLDTHTGRALWGATQAANARDALASAPSDVLDRVKREAAAQAFDDAAQKWSWGEWANAPRLANRVTERIANGNYVGDWLRGRAAAIREEADQ